MSAARHFLVVAHRGASAYEPENTLRAFGRAIELGADMSELDVHVSKDGHVMVMHNATVEKTTNGKGAVREVCDLLLKAQGKWEEAVSPWTGD